MTSIPPAADQTDTALSGSGVRHQVIHGVGWTALGRAAHETISFVVGIILARLLDPEAYGLIGMVFVFLQFARMFSDLGMAGAVIQRKTINSRQLSTLFWINLGAGMSLAIVFMLSAPLIAAFYHEPRLVPITRVIASMFAIGSLNDLQTALLRRSMQFQRQALISTLATLVGGGVAISMALGGYGVWSLVAQLFAATVVGVVVMWFTTPWKPQLTFNLAEVKDILKFSANLQGVKVANYFVQNIDNLLVGRFLDAVTLGLYRMAYKYMQLSHNLIVPILEPVLLPTLSRIQDEHDRLGLMYGKLVQIIAFASMPLAIGLIVTADTFVLTFLGVKWVETIPLLRVLALGAIVLPLFQARNWLVTALGRGDVLLRWQVIDAALSTVLFFIGVQFGVYGVALAFVVRTYLLFYPLLAFSGRLIGLPFRIYVQKIAPSLLASLLMGGLVWGGTVVFLDGLPVGLRLIIQVLGGGGAYLALSLTLRIEALHEIIRLLRGWKL